MRASRVAEVDLLNLSSSWPVVILPCNMIADIVKQTVLGGGFLGFITISLLSAAGWLLAWRIWAFAIKPRLRP